MPVTAPTPFIKPYSEAEGTQLVFFKRKQSSVILTLYFSSPKTVVGVLGTGRVPISQIKLPEGPSLGLK